MKALCAFETGGGGGGVLNSTVHSAASQKTGPSHLVRLTAVSRFECDPFLCYGAFFVCVEESILCDMSLAPGLTLFEQEVITAGSQ